MEKLLYTIIVGQEMCLVRNFSLKIKLSILVFAAIIPLIILKSAAIITQHKHAVNLELKSSQDFAEAVSIAFLNYLDRIWYVESVVGYSISEDLAGDAHKIQALLKKAADEDIHTVRFYAWVNTKGIIADSSDTAAVGTDISDREYIKRIMLGEDRVVSDLYMGRVSGVPSMSVSRGIRKDGELRGIVVASMEIDKLGLVLPVNRWGKTSSFGLIDRQGAIIYRNGTPNIPFDKRFIREDSPAWRALGGEVAIADEYISRISDDPYMGVSLPIPSIGWASFANVSKKEVLEKSNSDANISIMIMMLTVFLSFVIAAYLIEQLARPMKTLEQAANAISSHDYSVRTNIQGKDEFARAGWAFDQMAERIQGLENNRQLFLQMAAHELRNPMTGIKGITSLISHKMKNGKPVHNLIDMMEILEKEVTRLSTLLSQILDAFRTQRENVTIKEKFRLIDITEAVGSAVKFYSMDESHRIINKSKGPIFISGDLERLEDVVRNIIGNAIKYSPEDTCIEINTRVEDGSAVISVKDQGIGIPEGMENKIFDSFYRGDNFKGKDPGGMGLGLYICKDIIERHRGSIWVVNNQDKGSTFYIKLPLAGK